MKKVWQEDDATPNTEGHETLRIAWRRLFGEPLDMALATSKEDCGDHDRYTMPNGMIIVASYPGNNSIIDPSKE